MYFPYLRGRQNELIALRELIESDKLSRKIIPIIEPVRLSPTLVSTLNAFVDTEREIAVIFNPLVGAFKKEWYTAEYDPRKSGYKKEFTELYPNEYIIKAVIMSNNKDMETALSNFYEWEVEKTDLLVVNNNRDLLDDYLEMFSVEHPRFTLIPDMTSFRRRTSNSKVLLDDKFKKASRNSDYDAEPEFFSDDHLFYKEEYSGFSDYSIIGEDYQDDGFAPFAVAIHIVYFNDKNELYVQHFLSDSNEDRKDPALKFYEAVSKIASWYENNAEAKATDGLKTLLDHYDYETYPGLGALKKYSLKHHLELIGDYLDGDA
ncbi:MAG: sce7725 family protein [Eubacteriales bacterium]|nr:sce7725 family protein [Eubacteriales bacterium]